MRRRELEKNIKREYGKVLALLHAYACISTGVRFSVKNQMPKGKSVLVFSTKSNATTRENISNVYGAKTLLALTPLGLELNLEPSADARKFAGQREQKAHKIFVHGHISKPIFGEGRQTPDRQMFFVNSRPCGLPQIAKAFNEVYKSFNVSQSPFIFANFEMDTSSYDVNVSPDKRTILLHDAGTMIESLKTSLTELFENQDQTVPQSQVASQRQTSMKQAFDRYHDPSPAANTLTSEPSVEPSTSSQDFAERERPEEEKLDDAPTPRQSMQDLLQKFSDPHSPKPDDDAPGQSQETSAARRQDNARPSSGTESPSREADVTINDATSQVGTQDKSNDLSPASSQAPIPTLQGETTPKSPGVVQNAFDRMRPNRTPPDLATITIGDKTTTSSIGGSGAKRSLDNAGFKSSMPRPKRRVHTPSAKNRLGRSIQSFAAPGTQVEEANDEADEEEESEAGSPTYESEVEPGEQLSTGGSDGDVQSAAEARESGGASDSDESYVDDEEQKARDEARVGDLIRQAEETAIPSEHNVERANMILKKPRSKNTTVDLMSSVDGSISNIQNQIGSLQRSLCDFKGDGLIPANVPEDALSSQEDSAEKTLSLTVSKDDFAKMRVVGQFNLGFVLATRSPHNGDAEDTSKSKDELFIIDQHASDEKFNFERLQAETVVQNQRLVQPKTLDLTAVEEEVIIDNLPALEKNGFVVEVDTSGDEPIGRRCKLLSLPLSKEVVFDTQDLEELVVLLSEAPHGGSSSNPVSDDRYVPRPSKVRKMFAMRACRSSIMVGRSLTLKQMERVVKHMGTIEKPWNCPHGRPTMRHLMSLGQWTEWGEWDSTRGVSHPRKADADEGLEDMNRWKQFLEDYGNLDEG